MKKVLDQPLTPRQLLKPIQQRLKLQGSPETTTIRFTVTPRVEETECSIKSKQLGHSHQRFEVYKTPFGLKLKRLIDTNSLGDSITSLLLQLFTYVDEQQAQIIGLQKNNQRHNYQLEYLQSGHVLKEEIISKLGEQQLKLKAEVKALQSKLSKLTMDHSENVSRSVSPSLNRNKTEENHKFPIMWTSKSKTIHKDEQSPREQQFAVQKVKIGNPSPGMPQGNQRTKFRQVVEAAYTNKLVSEKQQQLIHDLNSAGHYRDLQYNGWYSNQHDHTIDDTEIMSVFEGNKYLQRFREIMSMSQQDFLNIYLHDQSIFIEFQIIGQYLLQFLSQILENGLKMKRLIRTEARLHSSHLLSDSFKLIVEETSKILDCDRASVFLIDRSSQGIGIVESAELWTKSAMGTKNIRISIKEGLAGYVASTGLCLNVIDAHEDKRFNPDIDRRTQYRTKSVLCVPIFDEAQQNTIGVIQAINKLSGKFFSKDDEGLIVIIAFMASQVFKNSLQHDSKVTMQNSLRALVSSGIELNQCRSLEALILKAEQLLTTYFEIPEAKIFIANPILQKLFRFNQDSKIIEHDMALGLVGNVFTTATERWSASCYQDHLFNSMIDINTKMPVLTYPLMVNETQILGIVQVIDQKGIANLPYSSKQMIIKTPFHETLGSFSQLFSQIYLLLQDSGRIEQNH